jgi:hypothetical protein
LPEDLGEFARCARRQIVERSDAQKVRAMAMSRPSMPERTKDSISGKWANCGGRCPLGFSRMAWKSTRFW